MNISKDTTLASFLILSPIFPFIFSKYITFIFLLLVFFRIILSENIRLLLKFKFIIFLFLMPSFLLTAFFSTQNLLRFTLLIFLTLGLPFKGFTINALSIRFISILSILYLSFTEILLAFNNTLIKDFQTYWYPLEFKDQTTEDVTNPWNFGFVNNFNELFSDGFRAGGIFYNPNVTALVLVLNYIIFLFLVIKFTKKIITTKYVIFLYFL